MSSFTNSFEYGDRVKMARWNLKLAREWKNYMDVSDRVKDIRSLVKCADVLFADLGTNEEELIQLVQTGYESEARTCLDLARGIYGYSRIHLYLRAVRNAGVSFSKRPTFHSFKWLIDTIFGLRPHYTRQYCIARTREYLTKANTSPSDIGTDEAELVRLES